MRNKPRKNQPKSRRRARRKSVFVEPKGVAGLAPNLTVSELAKLWRCTAQHVRNRIRAGQIRAIRFGNIFLIPVPEAQRLSQPVDMSAAEESTAAE
jgi:excisionase family DNA binding protein